MYTREASALDLFNDSIRVMGDATLCAVMEFDGRLDPGVLEEAAQACLLAHPILHSRLVRGDGPAFWEMVDPARVAPVRAEECADDYHPRIVGPVDPHGPLQFRVRLLRRPSGDIVVVNLSHAAADAFGLYELSSQLLQEYEDPGSIGPAGGGIPERDTLWTRGLYTGGKIATSEMRVGSSMWPDAFGTSRKPATYHRDRVDPARLDSVRASVRTLGGTINDAVVAAYYLAMSDLTGHRSPMAVFFPVNLRQHLNDGTRTMSNQSNNVCFLLCREAGEGMEEVLPRVIEETKRLKAGRIGIAEQVEMDASCDPEGRQMERMAAEMAAHQNQDQSDILFSNPGPFALPDVEGLSDAYVCFPGTYMPMACLLTSTFRRRMTITMGYQNSVRAREGTRTAMHLFRRHLLSLAGDD